MDGFDWNVFAAGSAGVATALVALVALGRRRTRRRAASDAVAVVGDPRRRIDLVAIDEGAAAQHAAAKETVTQQHIPTRDERSFDATETGERIDVERIADPP
jgi:hypothetical protein